MLRTPTAISTRTLLACLGVTTVLATGAATLCAAEGFAAAGNTSSATGVRITGNESAGADSGSLSTASGGISASGITTRSGEGYADASVASITVGMTSFGPISAHCENGVTTVSHPDTPSARNLKVTWGTAGGPSATAAVITITGAKGGDTRITAAEVSCGKTGDTSSPKPPTGTPGTPAPSTRATAPSAGHTTSPTHRRTPVTDTPAPAPQHKTGHIAVTG